MLFVYKYQLQKFHENPVTFLYIKRNTLYVTGFFMNFLKLAFIYKKHDTLRYVTFLYTKSWTLRKKQDI